MIRDTKVDVYDISPCFKFPMDVAAADGHLDVVQWLHEYRREECTAAAMDWAVDDSDFNRVLFLHAHRSEECSSQATSTAIFRNEFEVFLWLYESYPDKANLEQIRAEYDSVDDILAKMALVPAHLLGLP
ncbi:hypothetical protein FI667_g12017, partial [Globisporangium splendens]